MSQTPTPEYVPPPRGSSTGLIVGIVVGVIVLLIVLCGVGLLGMGFMAYRTVETQIQQPVPQMDLLQPPDPPVVEPPAEVPNGATPAP